MSTRAAEPQVRAGSTPFQDGQAGPGPSRERLDGPAAARKSLAEMAADGLVLSVVDSHAERYRVVLPYVHVRSPGVELPATIAFNPQFLADGLASLTGDRVSISSAHADAIHPLLLRDVEDTEGGFRYLIMPVRCS